jgi:hypothetical protein
MRAGDVASKDNLGQRRSASSVSKSEADAQGVVYDEVLKFQSPDTGNNIKLLCEIGSGHRIRHYGLFAGAVRADNIESARQLLAAPERPPAEADTDAETPSPAHRCPCCGGRMIIVETFEAVRPARSSSPSRIRINTS